MIFPVFGFYAYGQGYTITRLTDNNYVDGSPNIDNHGQVVWESESVTTRFSLQIQIRATVRKWRRHMQSG